MKPLTELTLEELKQLRKDWFAEAMRNGNIKRLAHIARELGNKLNHSYGPKYRYQNDVIEIYVDDYGGYMTVKEADKLRVSTHPNEKLYVKGEWEEIINRVYPEVQKTKQTEETSKSEQERLKLIEELS